MVRAWPRAIVEAAGGWMRLPAAETGTVPGAEVDTAWAGGNLGEPMAGVHVVQGGEVAGADVFCNPHLRWTTTAAVAPGP